MSTRVQEASDGHANLHENSQKARSLSILGITLILVWIYLQLRGGIKKVSGLGVFPYSARMCTDSEHGSDVSRNLLRHYTQSFKAVHSMFFI